MKIRKTIQKSLKFTKRDNQFNISRGLSFMVTLDVPWGIVVNFGKRSVQIQGLSVKNPSVGRLCHPWDKNEVQ